MRYDIPSVVATLKLLAHIARDLKHWDSAESVGPMVAAWLNRRARGLMALSRKEVSMPKGIGYGKSAKDRVRMQDASSVKETDRGRVAGAESRNPRAKGVGTARKSYERKHGEKM